MEGQIGSHVGRRRIPWRWAALCLLALLFLPIPALEATPVGTGEPILGFPVFPGSRFDLTFTHSIFGVPVRERFRVDWRGRLVLDEIQSTDPRVIGYYDIQGAQSTEQPGSVRIFGFALAHEHLIVRGTPIGGRALTSGNCRVPVAALAGDWNAIDLRVRLHPLVTHALNGRIKPCPTNP